MEENRKRPAEVAAETLQSAEMGSEENKRSRETPAAEDDDADAFDEDFEADESGKKEDLRKGWVDKKNMSNEKFETFYKSNPTVLHADEWDAFMTAVRSPLASCFRINPTNPEQARRVFDRLTKHFVPAIEEMAKTNPLVEPPRPLAWYPDQYGWHVPIPRSMLRRNGELGEFQKFLMFETDMGNISRQEAVSMIPAYFMDIEPQHKILDMCASPGSKTAQLLEMLHHSAKEGQDITGFVVANDIDVKRCYMLVHQLQRLIDLFPNVIITNHDATMYPSLLMPADPSVVLTAENVATTPVVPMRFDRILADTMCSGDGTIRKAPEVWKKWNAHHANGLHRMQVNCCIRALQMLEVGGLMVYSTCSMNPVEDEAVVAEVLRRTAGTVEIVDNRHRYPELLRREGTTTWKVMDKQGNLWDKYSDITNLDIKSMVAPSLFPPTAEEAEKFHLERCMRFLPHLQDTGGFFVTVLKKLAEIPEPAQPNNPNQANRRSKREVVESANAEVAAAAVASAATPALAAETPVASSSSESAESSSASAAALSSDASSPTSQFLTPFTGPVEAPVTSARGLRFIKAFKNKNPAADDIFHPPPVEVMDHLRNFFLLSPDFPVNQIFGRTEKGTSKKLVYTSKSVAAVLKATMLQQGKWRIVNVGSQAFDRNDANFLRSGWRPVQDTVSSISQYMAPPSEDGSEHQSRVLYCNWNDMQYLLQGRHVLPEGFTSAEAQKNAAAMEPGGCVVALKKYSEEERIAQGVPHLVPIIACFRGKSTISAQVAKEQLQNLRLRLGVAEPPALAAGEKMLKAIGTPGIKSE